MLIAWKEHANRSVVFEILIGVDMSIGDLCPLIHLRYFSDADT
jgi:hypothetical protein